MTATAQAPTNGATATQFPGAERLLEKINEGNPRHRAMPADMESKFRLAETMLRSGLCPTNEKRPLTVEQVFIMLQLGDELGIAPMQAVQGIAVVHGRPSVMYQLMLAVVQGSGKLESYREETTEDGSTVTVKRRGLPDPVAFTFTMADAVRAQLLSNPTWKKYPRDMLRNRAGGRALKIAFADVLAGVALEDEAEDIAEERAAEKAAAWILRAEDVSALKKLVASKKIPAEAWSKMTATATGGRAVAISAAGIPDYSREEWDRLSGAVRAWGAKAAPVAAPAVPVAAAPVPTSSGPTPEEIEEIRAQELAEAEAEAAARE